MGLIQSYKLRKAIRKEAKHAALHDKAVRKGDRAGAYYHYELRNHYHRKALQLSGVSIEGIS
jgi:hypothetical protein